MLHHCDHRHAALLRDRFSTHTCLSSLPRLLLRPLPSVSLLVVDFISLSDSCLDPDDSVLATCQSARLLVPVASSSHPPLTFYSSAAPRFRTPLPFHPCVSFFHPVIVLIQPVQASPSARPGQVHGSKIWYTIASFGSPVVATRLSNSDRPRVGPGRKARKTGRYSFQAARSLTTGSVLKIT